MHAAAVDYARTWSPESGQPGRDHVIVAHSAALIGAGLASMLRSVGSWSVSVCTDLAAELGRDVTSRSGIVVGDAPALRHAVDTTEQGPFSLRLVYLEDPAAPCPEVSSRAAISVGLGSTVDDLLDAISRLAGRPPAVTAKRGVRARGGLAPGVLRRVREYVAAKLSHPIELRDLARVAKLSECHFARAFTQSAGIPPRRYVMRCRVDKAALMIEQTDRPIAEIALEVGFCDQSHFTRMFAKYMNETPSRYRRRFR